MSLFLADRLRRFHFPKLMESNAPFCADWILSPTSIQVNIQLHTVGSLISTDHTQRPGGIFLNTVISYENVPQLFNCLKVNTTDKFL